ncbi:MAG: hypothetical protein sL5_05550 [Candidatus Mesenet longicola]|uniref:Uncharacterized protein n=1 Tax=Candidatus Mesenet longicola TaxID=1892558 RepID=A0A8J3MQH7_9RICK|nr:MAG: hypothetical protein sGL2_05460 [Candidatus Mesenet longicola]GHM59562.1 MAG: hypothetical protein sL5_05550 [Candidatus Mesenet longicola]
MGIFVLQHLQAPCKNKYDIMGNKSKGFNFCLHVGQNERVSIISIFRGRRYAAQHIKLPKLIPSKKNTIYST